MKIMTDQKQHWNEIHEKGKLEKYGAKPTDFCIEVLKTVKIPSKILELGCGVGNDSIAFANEGHTIVSTDFSETVIRKNTEKFGNTPNLSFKVMDMAEPMKFPDDEFDVVYARLSLHYFTDAVTKDVIKEIHRVLKPRGLLCFICKSIHDTTYGKGKEIEKDMFLDGQHIRHFFSDEYAKMLLKSKFEIERLDSGSGKLYETDSSFITVFARVIKL